MRVNYTKALYNNATLVLKNTSLILGEIMQINHDIFHVVDLDFTAVGLLSSAVVELGMDFTNVQLTEFIMNNKEEDRDEVMKSFQKLISTNLLLLKENRYYVNSDYIKL